MTSTTILTILLVFSFIIGRFLRRFETPHFVFSGMIYLLLGLLVGPHLGFGIIDSELLEKLNPLTDLMTGIAGFLLGLRLRYLLQNKRVFFTGAITAFFTFAVMSIVLFFMIPHTVEFEGVDALFTSFNFDLLHNINPNQVWLSLGVGATACSASLLSLGMVSKFQKGSSEITKALSTLAPALQFIAVLLLGFCLVVAKSRSSTLSLNLSVAEWIFATLCSGLICGLIFSLFIGRQSNPDRILLAALGAIIFAAGIGTILNVSSMFVCFLTGVTICLFSSYADTLKQNLVKLEEPIFVLLLIIGGASWYPQFNRIWMLPAIYFMIRAFIFSNITHRVYFRMTNSKLSRIGQGLLGQDLIAVAIGLSLAQDFPRLSQLILTTILGSIFLNDIVANSLLKKVILDNEQVIEVQPIEKQEGSQ